KIVALPLPRSVHATGSILVASATKFVSTTPVTIQNSLAAEITLFTGEPVRKRVRVVQHKVFGAKQIENQRRRGDGQQPGLAISLTVEMMIPGVQRDREKAPRLPFEALLWTAALPNRGCAATVKNVDQRLEHMSLRI